MNAQQIQDKIDALQARKVTTGGHGKRARIQEQIDRLQAQLDVETGAAADELGHVRAQIADLKAREAQLRDALIESGESAVEGELFRAAVVESNRTQVDWKAIAQKLEPSRQLITAHTTEKTVVSVRTNSRKGVAA